MAVVRSDCRLGLSQVSGSWYFPIIGQIFVGRCGGPRSTTGRRCLGSVKALSENTTQLSAQPHAGMQGGTSHLHHPCPGVVSRCLAPGSLSGSDTAGPAQVHPAVQAEPRLLRKSCEKVHGTLKKQIYSQG